MKIVIAPSLKRKIKKLHSNAKLELDGALTALIKNPQLGYCKKGDLAGIYVYKFRMVNQLTLIAYSMVDDSIIFLSLGSHENFYRDLKQELIN